MDIHGQAIRFLLEQTEVVLKKKIGHLSEDEIKTRCKCVVSGSIHSYYMDGLLIFRVDFMPRIAE